MIITSCIDAYQLSMRQQQQQDTLRSQSQARRPIFPLVMVDEAAQCTDPGLVCALVAS